MLHHNPLHYYSLSWLLAVKLFGLLQNTPILEVALDWHPYCSIYRAKSRAYVG